MSALVGSKERGTNKILRKVWVRQRNNECEKKLKEDEKDGETMPARLQHVLMASLRAMGAL